MRQNEPIFISRTLAELFDLEQSQMSDKPTASAGQSSIPSEHIGTAPAIDVSQAHYMNRTHRAALSW